MATVKVHLEPHKLDREYASPFTREVKCNDTIEFIAVGADFTITIPNKDDFLFLVGGASAGDNINETITDGTSKKWDVTGSSPAVLSKYYNVCWDVHKLYADRPGASPPRLVVIP